ncbi:MAG TPA: hypothetical protein VFG23_26955 [Polyangia bacterium]|nr:hypothetical protein [Polyangia bacterium]
MSANGERERPADADGLCWHCAHHRRIKTARSTFVMCQALPVKYPRQPVWACPAFQPLPPRPVEPR